MNTKKYKSAFLLEVIAKSYSLVNLTLIMPAMISAMGLIIFGYYNWLLSVGSLAARLIPMGILDSAFRTLPQKDIKVHYEIHRFVIAKIIQNLAIFYLIILALWAVLSHQNKAPAEELILISIVGTSVLIINMFQGVSRQSGFFINSYLILILQQLLFAGITIYVYRDNYAQKSIYPAIFCFASSSVLMVSLLYPYVILKLKRIFVNTGQLQKNLRYIKLFGKTNLLAGASAAAWEFSDKIMAGLQLTSLDNAKYQIISNISTMATTGLLSGFMVLFQYIIIKNTRHNDRVGVAVVKMLPVFILFFIAPCLMMAVEFSKQFLFVKYQLIEGDILALNILILIKLYLISTNPFIDSRVAKRGNSLSMYSYVLFFSSVLMGIVTNVFANDRHDFVLYVALVYSVASLLLQLIYSRPYFGRTSILLMTFAFLIYASCVYYFGRFENYTVIISFVLIASCILFLRKIAK